MAVQPNGSSFSIEKVIYKVKKYSVPHEAEVRPEHWSSLSSPFESSSFIAGLVELVELVELEAPGWSDLEGYAVFGARSPRSCRGMIPRQFDRDLRHLRSLYV